MPVRSGLPSAFRDTGAVGGVPLAGLCGHCAVALEHTIRINSAGLDIRRLLDHKFRGKIALKPIEQMTQRLSILLMASIAIAAMAATPPPRTPDGQPDLQETWTDATITPFERPNELAGKQVLTPAEAAEVEKKAALTRVDAPPKPGDVGNYNQVWFDSGTKVVATRQTSLVVEPPDGRVPVKPSAEAKR